MSKDGDQPFFRPPWRRALVVAICAAVVAFDLYHGNWGWALVFGGLGAYAIYVFFIAWDGNGEDGEDK